MATKNLVGNPNGIIEQPVNQNVSKSGFSDGISPSHFFTMNEGEIKLQYDELLEPNSEIRINNQYLLWQSPLVSRNLTNQRIRTHYIAQSIKNMWADWRSYIFGGRYGDFATPELHFRSYYNSHIFLFTSGSVATNTTRFIFRYRTKQGSGSWSSYSTYTPNAKTQTYLKYAFANAFLTSFGTGSLGEALGFQTETLFTNLNTPNPWPFMAYLNFYKWFVANKYVLRGNAKFKKIWFPDNEDDFKFHCGSYNKSTGIIGRFFSPEHRSGLSYKQGNIYIDIDLYEDLGALHLLDVDTHVSFKSYFQDEADGTTFTNDYTPEENTYASKLLSDFLKDRFLNYPPTYALTFDDYSLKDWYKIFEVIRTGIVSNGLPYSYSSGNVVTAECLDLFETRFMNFNKDYFTGGLISPLISGDYPKLANGNGTLTGLEAQTTLTGGSVSSTIDHVAFADGSNIPDNLLYNGYLLNRDSSGKLGNQGVNIRQDTGTIEDVSGQFGNLKSALDSAVITNTFTNPTAETIISGSASLSVPGFSIPDLRLLSATTDYLEALARSDGDYRNMTLAIYGVKPTEVSEAPIYLGGSSSYVQTENIFQTAPSSDSPLGSVTQTGYGGASDYIGSYFAKDTTVVLGFISVVPEIFYYQGVPKKWVMRHKEEHQNPKFNGISMQAIENRELFVSGNDSTDTDPFAYAPAWEFMRHRQNRLSGLLKPHYDPETKVLLDKPFTQMTQSRGWSSTPDFNEDFISTFGNISTEHLYTQDTSLVPEFTCAIKNSVTEILPITRTGVPQHI